MKRKATSQEVLDDGSDIEGENEGDDDEVKQAPPIQVDNVKYLATLEQWPGSFTTNGFKHHLELYSDDQHEEFRFHITEKAAGKKAGTGLFVPPFHPQWPHSIFFPRSTLTSFLKTLAKSNVALEILRHEVNFEYKVVNTPGHQTQNFQPKNLQWKGWSGMLQLEASFPDMMTQCHGFPQCLHHMIQHTFHKGPAVTIDKIVRDYLAPLQTIWAYMWQDVGVGSVSAVTHFIHYVVHDTIARSPLFKRTFKKDAEIKRNEMIERSPLTVPTLVRDRETQQAQGRVRKSLRRPQELHESDILNGVRKLTHIIWDDDGDTTKPIGDLEDGSAFSDRAKAICCLAELMCGSRQFGILLVNYFTPVNTHTMSDWKSDHDKSRVVVDDGRYESLQAISNLFGQTQKCVVVSRLTKEQTSEAQAAKLNRSLMEGEKKMAADEIFDRVIVKPINWMFVDPAFLNHGTSGGQTASMSAKEGLDIFLDMIKALRAYIKDKLPLPMEQKHEMWGLRADLVRQTPKKVRDVVQGLITKINRFARRVFVQTNGETIFLPNQGTHLFRKIYMNWAFHAFASDKMKETGFASAVLGHRGFAVSLNYTSLIITPSMSSRLTDMGYLKMQFGHLRRRLEALEERAKEDKGDDVVSLDDLWQINPKSVPVVNRAGQVVMVDKLRRVGGSQEDKLNTYIVKIRELVDKEITPTIVNQRKVGVTSNTVLRQALVADPRYQKIMGTSIE